MLAIPLSPVPSQFVSTTLAGQACGIKVYYRTTGLFLDLSVNDTLIIGGVICLNAVPIVRNTYLGFVGDLCFFDLAGVEDPTYGQLGARFILAYVPLDQQLPLPA